MSPIRIRAPLFTLVPLLICVLVFLAFLEILNVLRFMQCTAWVQLPAPPEKTAILLGSWNESLYVRAESQTVNYFRAGQWSKGSLPTYQFKPEPAPAWLMGTFESALQRGKVAQAVRMTTYSQVSYYTLLADGRILTCPTRFSAEIEGMIQSGQAAWLLIPLVGMLWSGIAFLYMLIDYGRPVIRSGWGGSKEV
jgi:hypothetical protein